MNEPASKVSWQMLAIIAAVFVYTGYGAMQLGGLQYQVLATSREIAEAKLATAALAAQAIADQHTLAESNTALKERVTRLETAIGERRK